jgi:hypothetical protein
MGEATTTAGIVPIISGAQKAFNARIKTYLERLTRFPITKSDIFQLEMEHNEAVNVSRMTVRIGARFFQDEPIAAIFEIKDWYVICTRSKGALAGSPRYIAASDVVGVVEYRDANPGNIARN